MPSTGRKKRSTPTTLGGRRAVHCQVPFDVTDWAGRELRKKKGTTSLEETYEFERGERGV